LKYRLRTDRININDFSFKQEEYGMAKILIVEDESKIARFVELELKYEGYEVEIAVDGRTGLDKALHDNVDLVLLDIMLPGLSGIEVCRRIRMESLVPIIMLTAKDDVTDKVAGLDMGADDYMTKPFAIEELLARIRVALNRQTKMVQSKVDVLQIGDLKLNITSHSAHYGEDELVLTKKEYELLEYLIRNKNIALTRDQLLNKVWDYEYLGDTNVVDVYIRYLRQKIDDKYGIHLISTVRGVGYIIKDEV
jgi:DNA-binding response OmpR family regulator